MKNLPAIALVAFCVVACGLSFVYFLQKTPDPDTPTSKPSVMVLTGTEPDHQTRALLRGIDPTEVDHIRLVGSGTSYIPEKGLAIRDPALIEEFIVAIQKAVKPPGTEIEWPTLPPDGIEIYLKGRQEVRHDTGITPDYDVSVLFFADVPPYTVGPDFQQALRRAGIRYGQHEPRISPFSVFGIGDDASKR